MIAIIDYSTGNLRSVQNALARLGAESIVTSNYQEILSADRVLIPGVGHAAAAMANLQERGLDKLIPTLTMPVLGICIGMQLMCRHSEEGDVNCLSLFNADVKKFTMSDLKVPHMGWNRVWRAEQNLQVYNKVESLEQIKKVDALFTNIQDGAYFYYVHSYAPTLCEHTIATTNYGVDFSGALANGNFFGTQFHPEKSGDVGEILLKNFLEMK